MRISIIIPVLNEEETIAATLEALSFLAPNEVIVVDGGSADHTREIAVRFPAAVLSAPPGRARQMNHGAGIAQGDVFLFLHADTRLPPSAVTDIRRSLIDSSFVGGRFDVKLDGQGRKLKMIGAFMNLRSRLTKMSTGDQAIFVRRETFEQLAGFPDIPLMEDLALSRMLKKKGRITCLKSQVVTSARRWEKEGIWRTVLRMWTLRFLYFAGVSPDRLSRYYCNAR
jgi:rSAM/selenodomain-associated transferase 2